MSPPRIAIVGSRGYTRIDLVQRMVHRIKEKYPGVTIVSGAGGAVDLNAAKTARRLGLSVQEYPAKWRKEDGSKDYNAGYARNHTIVDDCTDLIAFWDGTSHGTAHSIALATLARKLRLIVDSDGKRHLF